jgi:hypothetical protein
MCFQFEEQFARTRAIAHALKVLLDTAADLEDAAATIGAAVFLAGELDDQLERVQKLADACPTPKE